MKKIAIAVATVLAGGVISNVALADTYMGGKVGYNSLNDACYLNEPCDDDSFAASMHLATASTSTLQRSMVLITLVTSLQTSKSLA